MKICKSFALTSIVACFAIAFSGCADVKPAANKPAGSNVAGTNTATSTATADNHSGWWCAEHGIPEEQCSMCSSKAAADCKAKGDWCEEHNRAESQCFICDPSRAESFAKLYEAKYGEKPPAIDE